MSDSANIDWINKKTGMYRCLKCGFQYNVKEHGAPCDHLKGCDAKKATDWDHRIIDGVSVALHGQIGQPDDVERLMRQIQDGPSPDKLKTACEIAVAYIRWAQDLKRERNDAAVYRL